MRTPLNQRMIERAVRAAHKVGCPPSSVECHPDGRIVLCFGASKASPDDHLDREMEQWRHRNGTA
jgi:hypothetical protein